MKKFDRLPPEARKAEICQAALTLFREKGFAATTMENIVERVSLSKGGVYRLYPSTAAILGDLMLRGMHLRNAYYEEQVQKAGAEALTLETLVQMIGDSLLLYPELSAVYVEFLWEKRRSPALEALYQDICRITVEETGALLRRYGAEDLLPEGETTLARLADVMNATVLSLHTLGLWEDFDHRRGEFCAVIAQFLTTSHGMKREENHHA